jgi:translation initiation factor IF-3
MRGVRGFLCARAASPGTGPTRLVQQNPQGGHISVEPRINERIRVPEVRLVGPNGEQVGIVALNDALRLAQEADLDLVEVAPMARPPVCKLMDYGKFKYESALKARESRKNQAQTVIKEIKLRPKIDPHDYGTKKSHVERFLRQGDKVKVTIMFRGREQSRPELGFRLLQRLAGDVEELGFVESAPKQDGRNMIMVIGPHRRKSEARAEQRTHASERAGSRHRHEAEQAVPAEAAEQAAPVERAVPAEAVEQPVKAEAVEQPVKAERAEQPVKAERAVPAEAATGEQPAAAPAPKPEAAKPSPPPARSQPAATPRPGPRPSPAGIAARSNRASAARAQAETAAGRDA